MGTATSKKRFCALVPSHSIAQVSEPVPAEEALAADDQVVAEGLDEVEKGPRAAWRLTVEEDSAVGVKDTGVHGPGVQVDTGVVPVLLGVESHGGLFLQGFSAPRSLPCGWARLGGGLKSVSSSSSEHSPALRAYECR